MIDSTAFMFNEGHVKKVCEFMKSYLDTDILHIHCNDGISRSPTLAISIAKWLNIKLSNIYSIGEIMLNESIIRTFKEIVNKCNY